MEKQNFFIDPQKNKVNQKTYIDFLKTSLLPECRRLYPDDDVFFLQDSAPSHRVKATQNFLRDNTPDFISSQEWTPHSPDLNPLDYSVWEILQELVYKGRLEPFANLKDLQNVIRDKWHDVDDHTGSTQPCIPPGSLNRVPASAGVRAGTSPLPGGR